jgi:hypothetical protein
VIQDVSRTLAGNRLQDLGKGYEAILSVVNNITLIHLVVYAVIMDLFTLFNFQGHSETDTIF